MWKRCFRAHLYGLLVIGVFLGLLPYLFTLIFGVRPFDLPTTFDRLVFSSGATLAVIGGSLSYWCMILFVTRGEGTAFPEEPPKRLVALGPYRFVRNPMYIGNLALAVGIGTVAHSMTYLAYCVLLAVITHFYIIWSEEPVLRRRYGHSYDEYCLKTHRWIPSLPARAQTGTGSWR